MEPDKAPKEKKPLTEEQRIKRNKMIAIPCMFLVCGLVLWLIFKPSASEGEKGSKGFNMEMPDAEKTDVEADKRNRGAVAYANSGGTDTDGSQFYIVTGGAVSMDTLKQYEEHGDGSYTKEQKELYTTIGGIFA